MASAPSTSSAVSADTLQEGLAAEREGSWPDFTVSGNEGPCCPLAWDSQTWIGLTLGLGLELGPEPGSRARVA